MLTETEKKVIAAIQGDMPICAHPFEELAKQTKMTEETFLSTLTELNKKGIIRRFGATLRHQKSGFAANAMVAWQVDEKRVNSVGEKLATYRQVSHCYLRPGNLEWPYNLYTMIHGADEDSCHRIAEEMARDQDLNHYKLLFSRKELKKISMTYFPDLLSSL